jgi:transglutaminase-like putative cysteine protease
MIFSAVASMLTLFVGWMIFALPATWSLGNGIRPGLEPLTLDEAVEALRQRGLTGATLIEEARKLVITRMQYCRRNSFDTTRTAFRRGYGYCQQQAFALAYILQRFGFEAKVVHAFRNRFPDGSGGGHAWVRLRFDGITKDIDATHVDVGSDILTFTPLTKVRDYSTLFRYFAGWGSIGVNAYRYYRTGKDK